MAYTTSPNMSLTLPGVLTELGPAWASELNTSLTLVDAHDHSSGKGVLITPAGLNISSDLSFGSNNAINLRSSRYSSQSGTLTDPADVGCLYVAGNELYYNDYTGGNKIQITNAGNVNAGAGSITGLSSYPSASATYNGLSGTFIWHSGLNISADMDAKSYIFRNSSASSFGLTVQAPTLGSSSSLTLPSPVGAQSFLAVDASGVMTGYAAVSQGITASMIASGTLTTTQLSASAGIIGTQLASGTLTTTQISTSAGITPNKLDSLSTGDYFASSSSSGSFSSTSATPVDVTNLVNIQSTLSAASVRPCVISFIQGSISHTGSGTARIDINANNGATVSQVATFTLTGTASFPASSFNTMSIAGKARFGVQVSCTAGAVQVTDVIMQVVWI